RNFLLHDIPVFNHFTVLHSEDIDSDERFCSPAYIASVNHHEIALRDDHARLVGEVLLQGRNEIGDRFSSVRDGWIVLHIVSREVPIHNGNITLDERSLEHFQHDLFAALHVDLAVIYQSIGKSRHIALWQSMRHAAKVIPPENGMMRWARCGVAYS